MITTETNEQYHANDAIGSTSVKRAALNSVAHLHGMETVSYTHLTLPTKRIV